MSIYVKLLLHVNETLMVIDDINKHENRQRNFQQYLKKITLLAKIIIKSSVLVELDVGNCNIEDDLINGVYGI